MPVNKDPLFPDRDHDPLSPGRDDPLGVSRRSDEDIDLPRRAPQILIDIGYLTELIQTWHERAELGAAAYFTPISAHLSLPHLRGFWPFSSIDQNNNPYDLSGQARHLAEVNTVNYKSQGLTPYCDFDGAGYLSRGDEAGLSVSPDITFGAWIYLYSAYADVMFMGKMGASGGGDLSYGLRAAEVIGVDRFQLHISDDGTNDETLHIEPETAVGAWNFVVGRFTNTVATLFCNHRKATDTFTATSINDSTQSFTLGQSAYTGATTYLDGRLAYPFLCAQALEDTVITHLFEATRAIFGR